MLGSQVQPNNLTFPSLIKSACSSFFVSYGVSLYGQDFKRGVLWICLFRLLLFVFYGEVADLSRSRKMFVDIVDPCVVACNSMIDACGRYGDMDSAFELFKRMRVTDVVSWTSVINGFSKNGLHPKVVMLFGEMIKGVTPNEATLVSVLSSCANLDPGDGRMGKQMHVYVLRKEMILTTTFGTVLLDMYGYVWKSRLLGDGINHIRLDL